jgi:protein-tyrosine phosphatase
VPRYRFASAAPEEQSVYGACEPGFGSSSGTVDDWIGFVRARGIERVLCLLEYSQLRAHDDLLERYREAFGQDAVRHVPTADHRIVREDRLTDELLPFIGTSVRAGNPVVVHCKAGLGRTGQVLAAWLVHSRDYAPAEALATVEGRYRKPAEAVERGLARRADLLDLLTAVA